MLRLRTRVDVEAMVIKGYSAFPKTRALLEPYNQIVYCHISDTSCRGKSHPSTEVQSVISIASSDLSTYIRVEEVCYFLGVIDGDLKSS